MKIYFKELYISNESKNLLQPLALILFSNFKASDLFSNSNDFINCQSLAFLVKFVLPELCSMTRLFTSEVEPT